MLYVIGAEMEWKRLVKQQNKPRQVTRREGTESFVLLVTQLGPLYLFI